MMQPVAPLRCCACATSQAARGNRYSSRPSWPSRRTQAGDAANTSSHQSRTYASGSSTLLEHVHLKGRELMAGLVSYDQAEAAQEEHRTRFLCWKAMPEEQKASIPAWKSPKPRLISFESAPVFTLGRRQEHLAPEQMSRLQKTLEISLPHRRPPFSRRFCPLVKKTNRGGLTTYHGPGQMVLWPVLDMHSPLYPKYGVASYANHLETTTQRFLSELFGIPTYVVGDEPGVWVSACAGQPRKIAALGVHHRRYVTALGIAVNIDIPVTGSEAVNPWARFVPCGLDGRLVTSVASEVGTDSAIGWDLEDLAGRWAALFEEGLLDETKRRSDGGEANDDGLRR
ncbi:hypothetical protein UVI_02056900 [Ustilaginoidea virens]|nr:hypothetical protein UVI_02056900 [Ustilaginoidea virens]